MLYQLVKIPTTQNIVIELEANTIEEVRRYAAAFIDPSCRWIIKLQGRNVGELFEFIFYTCYYSDKPERHTRNHWVKSMFITKEAALAARNEHRAEAEAQLELAETAINNELRALGVTLGYHMEGDTYGIYNDYMYVSVKVNGYYFERKLEN